MSNSTTSDNENISFSKVSLPKSDVLKRLAISESGFIFDPGTGYSFSVNETGLNILRGLQKGKQPDNILEDLLTEYQVSFREAERDVIEYIGLLRKQLEGNPE
ncbi:MAG: PqqD family protein [Gammaproteobacteria bacterium]|nr:PqqD family protein [Gammaproteobacteria bacterium]